MAREVVGGAEGVIASAPKGALILDMSTIDPDTTDSLAHAARVPMPIAAAAHEAFSTARARGFGGQDFSAMADAHCDLAGIEKPRLKR